MRFKKNDKWWSKNGDLITFDKLEHIIREAVLTAFLALLGAPVWLAFILIEAFGFGWEIRNGTKPYNPAGDIEGFSWLDIIANQIGIAITIIAWRLIA